MKIFYNKFFPPKHFYAINILGLIFARKEYAPLLAEDVNHERIHTRQMCELLVVFFYLAYIVEWLVRLIQYRNMLVAYRNISFEREAYAHMNDMGYLRKRKFLAFFRYYK